MNSTSLTTCALGFVSRSSLFSEYLKNEDPKEADSRILAWNMLNIIGYIPVLGIISGIFRQMILKKDFPDCSNDPRNHRFANFVKIQRVRSWMEIFGIEFLLLVPDLIFTIGRKHNGNPII